MGHEIVQHSHIIYYLDESREYNSTNGSKRLKKNYEYFYFPQFGKV